MMLNAIIYQGVEVFCVVTNSDTIEGRGHRVELGWFKHQTDAEIAAVGKGVFGSAANVEPHRVDIIVPINDAGNEDWSDVRISGNRLTWSHSSSEQVRLQALAKLSSAERLALGL